MPRWYIKFITSGASHYYPITDFPFLPRIGEDVTLAKQIWVVTEIVYDLAEHQINIRLR